VGPSGCGKTTLLRCIAGLEFPSNGAIILSGQIITKQRAEKRPIVMMFQQPLLFPHLTVIENIIYGLKGHRIKKREQLAMGHSFLEKIELTEYAERYPYELSGGQKQRVALARALILKPRLLLLDEPFSSLDPALRGTIRSWVRGILKEQGMTAIFVTHDKEEAMIMGDQLAVMKDGSIQQIGKPLDVYLKPKNKQVAEFFCDGLTVDEHWFIPTQSLALHLASDRTTCPNGHKQQQKKIHSSDEWIECQGYIQNHWMQHGQHIYQIWLDGLQQDVTLPSDQLLQVNDAVCVRALKAEAHRFKDDKESDQ
jgi:ABC-type Fe3+/spermidine/putrescine transport system ATPase subunit